VTCTISMRHFSKHRELRMSKAESASLSGPEQARGLVMKVSRSSCSLLLEATVVRGNRADLNACEKRVYARKEVVG
jgi:hypothetical protein